MKTYLLLFVGMFLTIRAIHNPDYDMENGAIVIQLTEKRAETISHVGVKLFDFEI
jgi:Na+/H+ antiporter NhaD/arsenite permease-like protein